jgi:uncharacterized protein YkwD
VKKTLVLVLIALAAAGCAGSKDSDDKNDSPSTTIQQKEQTSSTPSSSPQGTKTAADREIDRERLLILVNNARESGHMCGDKWYDPAPAITWDDKVAQAALIHSEDMDKNHFFSHTGSDGSEAGERLVRAGYKWHTWGENIAWGYESEEEVIEGWLQSPGHCENIMNKEFTHMGVAKSGQYWTQLFATPAR